MEERQLDQAETAFGVQDTSSGTEAMDPEFARGLESILGPMRQNGAAEEEIAAVTARALQFYLARQSRAETHVEPSITSSKNSGEGVDESQHPHTSLTTPSAAGSREAAVAPSASNASEDQPPYPLSFDELAEMIATGRPVPGIREIPNKLNENAPTQPVLAKTQMRKPWENNTAKADTSALTSVLHSAQQA